MGKRRFWESLYNWPRPFDPVYYRGSKAPSLPGSTCIVSVSSLLEQAFGGI